MNQGKKQLDEKLWMVYPILAVKQRRLSASPRASACAGSYSLGLFVSGYLCVSAHLISSRYKAKEVY